MAGRPRPPPRHAFPDHRRRPYPPPPLHPRPPHPELYEEELDLQLHELHRLSAANRSLLDDRAALTRELAAARDEIHRLGFRIEEVQVERDAHVREMIEKGLKLEADLRAMEGVRGEVVQLRGEVGKIDALRKEQVQGLTKELERLKGELKQTSGFKNEVEVLRQELVRARSAFEYEKKGNVELVEQRQVMEQNLISMAREVEKLRADLALKDGKSWGAAYDGRAYMKLNSTEGGYPTPYGDGYGLHPVVGEKNPVYGIGSGTWGSYDKSHAGAPHR